MAAETEIAEESILARETRDGVRRLTMNRPAQRNALSLAMMAELRAALEEAEADAATRVVVIAANGPAFCAGHDLKELRATPTRDLHERTFAACSRLMRTITSLPKPVIAQAHGIATAAGCQLVATCDLAIAAQSARFATPGVNIGLFCSTPMVALSRVVGRRKAMEMLLTGDMLSAEDAVAAGLINRTAPDDRLEAETDALARRIASKSPLTLAIGKEAFYRQVEMGLTEAYAYTSDVMTLNMRKRDAEEGIDAFLEKRAPVWRGE